VGCFVGVGIDEYEVLEALGYAVAEVGVVGQRLSPVCEGGAVVECDGGRGSGCVGVVGCQSPLTCWCCCGLDMVGLRVNCCGCQRKKGEILCTEVVSRCAGSGASQLLLIVDTCHAEVGVADAARVASALLAEFPPGDERVWFGIVVSCRAGQTARDGAFGALLERLLTEGPRSADMRRRWSRHNRLIFGDDLGAALLEDWDDEDQAPDFVSRGRRWFMVPNPLWEPDAPEQVVEQFVVGRPRRRHR